jgi:hypothetical protein
LLLKAELGAELIILEDERKYQGIGNILGDAPRK